MLFLDYGDRNTKYKFHMYLIDLDTYATFINLTEFEKNAPNSCLVVLILFRLTFMLLHWLGIIPFQLFVVFRYQVKLFLGASHYLLKLVRR